MAASRRERILILCKTYPSPSGKHIETSCVAGMLESGSLIRLFPVPFRLIRDDQQFKKWQWISAQIQKANNDRRPESHKIFVDTIRIEAPPLSTRRKWAARREALGKLRCYSGFMNLVEAHQTEGLSLGLIKPHKILSLDITPADQPHWSEDELKKLIQNQRQAGLFDDEDARAIRTLRKLPFSFYYRYECEVGEQIYAHRHKIADWEVGALYWNCHQQYGDAWESAFRAKLEQRLPAADLMFLMGNIHRFPDQWLIVSLIYPPRQMAKPNLQVDLPF